MRATSRWVLTTSLLLWLGSAATAAPQQPRFSGPGGYVLALGDSLAFGYQQFKFLETQDPADFTFGFADYFATRLNGTAPGQKTALVNLACPGESASTFLSGPCLFHSILGFELHQNYDGSQVDAAEAFLGTHRGRTGTILVSLGSNDIFAVSNTCGGLNTDCFVSQFPAVLAGLAADYAQVLGRLRQAAPNAEIITLGLYNPFAVIDPATNLVAITINQLLDQVSAAYGARFANPFPAFNLTPPQPGTLCALSLVCTLGDIHPSDTGYQVLGAVMWDASGYRRFEPPRR